MDEYGLLSMDFKLADSQAGESSPAEFRFLFDAIDEITRALIFNQVASFVDFAQLGDKTRNEVFLSAFRLKNTLVSPVDVVSIGRKSPWTVVVNIPVTGVLWILHKMIGPEIVAAWGESKLKEQFKEFVRVRCSPSFGPKFSLIKVDRCLQNIIDRSLLLGLWEL